MNILYLHGLHSKLSPQKRKILEIYGKVYAPDIAYEAKHIQPVEILKQFPDTEFNVVIGSSMGALNAYIISENIGRCALLFNPPLSKYKPVTFATTILKAVATKHIVLGGKDEVVNPAETLKFLGEHLATDELNIKTFPDLTHRIPLDLFEEQLKLFFSSLCY
ncbi:hypothetical protein [Christiangramia salexigens]|uniref:Alpha/beta hydrolase n=1 Tax=Christiangramia salexigens TaxID=1913577 RepID=A0A1L3J5F8_9FLAO|nr:hypothetical protein [Christiangramia salexigens]APG60334.1 hypothetical protein LPB144_07900 [Christiangramia salexigens]